MEEIKFVTKILNNDYHYKPFYPNLTSKNLFACFIFTAEEYDLLMTTENKMVLRPCLGMLSESNRCSIYKLDEIRFNLMGSKVTTWHGVYSDWYDYIDINSVSNGYPEYFIVNTVNGNKARKILQRELNGPLMILGMIENYSDAELERIYLQLYKELNLNKAQKNFMNNIAHELTNKIKIVQM